MDLTLCMGVNLLHSGLGAENGCRGFWAHLIAKAAQRGCDSVPHGTCRLHGTAAIKRSSSGQLSGGDRPAQGVVKGASIFD